MLAAVVSTLRQQPEQAWMAAESVKVETCAPHNWSEV